MSNAAMSKHNQTNDIRQMSQHIAHMSRPTFHYTIYSMAYQYNTWAHEGSPMKWIIDKGQSVRSSVNSSQHLTIHAVYNSTMQWNSSYEQETVNNTSKTGSEG